MVNYYKLLDIGQNAQEDDIKEALKEKNRLWIQRQNAPKPEQQQQATNNLRLVPEIEEMLLDKQKRKEYDSKLQNAPKDESHVDAGKIEADNLVKEGWRLFYDNEIADALMVATKATELQGDNPDAWALLGRARAEWGEVEDAIYEYKRAIKLRPNDATFYYELGGIYEDEKQWEDAMDQYSKAAQIDSQKTVYRASVGSVYVKVEMYDKGIELLKKCVSEEPENKSYKYLLAIAYNDSAIAVWSESPYAYTHLGRAITTEEQAKESYSRLKKAELLRVDDSGLNEIIKSNMAATEWALAKHWDWTWERVGGGFVSAVIYPILIVLISLGLMASGTLVGFIIGAILIAWYIWVKVVPGWKSNARQLSDEKEMERVR